MRRYLYSIALILFLKISGFAQSYGLTFKSHEVVLEKRTSLDLSPEEPFCFSTNFELAFDINFLPHHDVYFGYVVRIISKDNQNIDLIFNQKSGSFKVIIGESFSGISFIVDSARLHKDWNKFALKFNLEKRILQFEVNGKLSGTSSIPVTGNCFKFLWGANDFQKFKTRDVPPMQIKDIRISEKDVLKYSWPLDEGLGDTCYDKVNGQAAIVKNPVWIKPKYQKWDQLGSFKINGYSGVAYDAKHDKLYISGSDSMAVYEFRNEQNPIAWLPTQHQELLMGNQAVYDTGSNKLYNISIDQKKITYYKFESRQWNDSIAYGPLTEFWHANKFISPADSSLYIVGGYGQLRYKNLVQRFHFPSGKWDTVTPSGEYLPPRYLSALGMDSRRNFAYIIGGYGSHTGDQMLDPRYYYDLFRYDIRGRSFKKLYTLKPLNRQFTFANSLVIGPRPNQYYGLIFSNDSFNSNLQLIEGSFTDSAFRTVGNPIPYSFHDVQSFSDLYYSPISNKLIAVTLLYSKVNDKEKNTEVKIYSISYPPEPADAAQTARPEKHNRYFFLFPILGIICIALFFVFRKSGKPSVAAAVDESTAVEEKSYLNGLTEKSIKSSIYLFGQFQVFDREGHDITRLFTPLLKELFLIIVIYTIRNGRGISSEALNEILWHDKSEKDAKNNRSVNIAKLKTILEKVGNCLIHKESGYWQFQIIDEHIYVDYGKYVSLLQGASDPGKAYIHPLVDIIKRGAFLYQTEYNWLDNAKSEISNAVIDLCLGFIKSQTISKDPEFIIEVINCIFYFDQLNEDALTYKCKSLILLKRHTLANNIYLKFFKDYKDIYGTDFDKSFTDIIN